MWFANIFFEACIFNAPKLTLLNYLLRVPSWLCHGVCYGLTWHCMGWDNPKWQQLHKIRIVSVLYFQIEHWSRIGVILSHCFRIAEAHLFLIVTLEFLSCKGPIWDPRIVIVKTLFAAQAQDICDLDSMSPVQ